MKHEIDRREFGSVVAAAAAATTLLQSKQAHAQQGHPGASPAHPAGLVAHPPEKAIVPLPFAAGSLPGLSERMLTSHHDNNYASAVRKLNEIRQQLNTADPAQSGAYWSLYGSLRSSELAARNSAHLHELYFANMAAAQTPGVNIAGMLATRFGSLDRFRDQLLGAAKASNGWVVLVADPQSRTLEIVQTEGHAFGAWEAAPLVVLDMFEHAYAIDFGANKAAYFDAFYRNLGWNEVGTRTTRALGRM